AAAVELLREEGSHGLTIEAVAARSGVAKTTIYRQFADREELHLAAVHSVGHQVPIASSADLLDDLVAFCVGLNDMLRSGGFGALLPTALDGAERSESFSEMMHEVGVERRQLLADRLRLAQRGGVLPASVDLDVLTSQLVGPLFYRRFISRQATSPAFVGRHVAGLLTPLVSTTPRVPASRGSGAPSRSPR
ncbi:MAG: TetR/AcrR family transcriptional regulator, partial [Ilumatobacteraceae bacterium]